MFCGICHEYRTKMCDNNTKVQKEELELYYYEVLEVYIKLYIVTSTETVIRSRCIL